MRNLMQLVVLLLLFSIFTSPTHAKSVIEPCNSSDSCASLLSYRLPWDSKLSEISFRFKLNITDLLAANSINILTTPSQGNQILAAKTLLKVPISCPCVDGIRRSVSTTYTVRPADSLESISEGFGRLVSAEQIKMVNNIEGSLTSGETILIPLPCTCFGNSNNGASTVFMSYVVQSGESLMSIGMEFGMTVMELVSINGLGHPVVDPGDILAIPIPACSSANLNWYNESLIVPNGSYALTANNCIKCTCRSSINLNLQCSTSGLDISCSHLQCKGTNLFIGDFYTNQTMNGYCNVTKCIYRGHSGRKIFRSIVNTSAHVRCSGMKDFGSLPPALAPYPSSVPSTQLSPSCSPYPGAFRPSPEIGALSPTATPPMISSYARLSPTDYFFLLHYFVAIGTFPLYLFFF
ncbi:lysM domain-containing GPI-anchored protein 1 [Ziziphus jujuba]|uniref:LysM domain-containing GPI-anchored protein 1 n=1 Tax=Ziziphus jujuba TaxID=326968 RepID=A0A6P3ZQC5_ZIZJJ|nr:lysM domain-containing GPI-anchored protein 1 [Ziziphus jujuba]